MVLAATATMASSGKLEGKWSVRSVSCPPFPAEVTSSTPLAAACWTADCSAAELSTPPHELLMTAVLLLRQYSQHLIASETQPLPCESMNLQGTIAETWLIPDTPTSLLPTAPTTPATNVPWPLSSATSPDLPPLTKAAPKTSSTMPLLSSSLPLPQPRAGSALEAEVVSPGLRSRFCLRSGWETSTLRFEFFEISEEKKKERKKKRVREKEREEKRERGWKF